MPEQSEMASELQIRPTGKLDLSVSIENQKKSNKLQLSPKCKQNIPRIDLAAQSKIHGKRRCSFGNSDIKSVPPFKRRNKGIIPPTKFLLGGNINDPLNLGSLADEEINRSLNEVTPYSSPIPTPRHRTQVEVLIPPNINDPLNLNAGDNDELELNLISPKARRKKHRKKKKHCSGETLNDSSNEKSEELIKMDDEESSVKEEKVEDSSPKMEESQRKDSKLKKSEDKIVSPVIPQHSARKRLNTYSKSSSKDEVVQESGHRSDVHKNSGTTKRPSNKKEELKKLKFRPKDAQFQYGNYNRYYGYRNMNMDEDPRLKCMRKDWFYKKDVLDIGCNVGFFTFSIAKDFQPRRIVGLDIDSKLIKVAKKNVRHYISNDQGSNQFPISLPILFGPIAAACVQNNEDPPKFPSNIFFIQGNYVLERDELLETQQQEFDTILCLSLTKWVHLNWGDDGLKRMFKRIYCQLRPGGHLILEAQSWKSYTRKKKLTETIYSNYQCIQFRPEQFTEYLLSQEVGFKTCEVIDTPYHLSKGFRRPIQIFTKGEGATTKEIHQTVETCKEKTNTATMDK